MKNVMMVLMLVFAMCAGSVYSFAEEAKAPAAQAASVLPASSPVAAVAEAPAPAAVEPKAEDALAVKVEEATEPPAWMKSAIGIALKIPYVGPILVEVLKWMGVLSALLTALAGILLALGKLLEKMGKSIGFLVKIKSYLDKLYPWVAWLSMFNVQPKKEEKPAEKKSA